ncbi:hypothetical protein M3Y99_01370100 [Aphelenchoides fujianensis]|nr:hypothetical protein M3Y99_01370100 [Aphelenchoides fujianensis]
MIAKTLVLLAAVAAVGFACQCRKTTQKEQFEAADVVARIVVTNRRFARDHVIYDIRYVEVFKPNQQVPSNLNANSTSGGQPGRSAAAAERHELEVAAAAPANSNSKGGNSQQNGGQQQQNGTSSSQQQRAARRTAGSSKEATRPPAAISDATAARPPTFPPQISTPISAAACGAVGLVPAGPGPTRRSIEYLIAGKRENDSIAISACSGIPPRDNQFGTPLGALRWNLVNSELQQKLRSGQVLKREAKQRAEAKGRPKKPAAGRERRESSVPSDRYACPGEQQQQGVSLAIVSVRRKAPGARRPAATRRAAGSCAFAGPDEALLVAAEGLEKRNMIVKTRDEYFLLRFVNGGDEHKAAGPLIDRERLLWILAENEKTIERIRNSCRCDSENLAD